MKTLYTLLILALVAFVGCTQQQVEVIDNTQPTEEPVDEPADEPVEAELTDTRYDVNPEESTLRYESSRLVGNPHTGNVAISEGMLEREDGTFTGGKFVFDMNTITDDAGSDRYIGHVKSDDFFAVDTYPTSTLVITSMEGEGTSYTVTGDLTIKDQTHEITFPADVTPTADGLRTTAEFSIDRTRWGIIYDSGNFFEEVGDRAIKDDILFTVDVMMKG